MYVVRTQGLYRYKRRDRGKSFADLLNRSEASYLFKTVGCRRRILVLPTSKVGRPLRPTMNPKLSPCGNLDNRCTSISTGSGRS
jgi:hypothetical protein